MNCRSNLSVEKDLIKEPLGLSLPHARSASAEGGGVDRRKLRIVDPILIIGAEQNIL